MFDRLNLLLVIILVVCSPTALLASEWTGEIATELRYFPQDPISDEQFNHTNLSVAFKPEYYHEWDDGQQSFTFAPFLRLDQHDPERTHFDIRELTWLRSADNWELRLGIRRVFWGVTEFQHLVDIINQTDQVESVDDEDTLGQPMINLALIRDWGTLDFFVLPGFRERTFPGREGRLHNGIIVDTGNPEYESGAEDKHIDFAIRWTHTIGPWDIGLSHFYGTSRDPRLLPQVDASGRVELIPFYDIINQTGLDLQYTGEEWLWKLEAISRSGQGEHFVAATGGFEYTFVGVFESAADLGIIAEYAYDDRGDDAPTPFEDDLVVGTRLALNDVQSTELLAGVVFDLDSNGRFYSLEASRRLGDNWKLNLEARFNSNLDDADPAASLSSEDFWQLELSWFF